MPKRTRTQANSLKEHSAKILTGELPEVTPSNGAQLVDVTLDSSLVSDDFCNNYVVHSCVDIDAKRFRPRAHHQTKYHSRVCFHFSSRTTNSSERYLVFDTTDQQIIVHECYQKDDKNISSQRDQLT